MALAATFVALAGVKDRNITLRMNKAEAEGCEKHYEALNGQHDLFDLSDAAMSVAIALLGVTALTRKRWLLGVAGFMNISIHPEHLVSWLA